MNKFIFIWKWSSGFRWNRNTNKVEKCSKFPIIGVGSDCVVRIDARLSQSNIEYEASLLAKQRGGIGYSIGNLSCHDPNDSYATCYKHFTKI